MKKYVALILAVALALTLCACDTAGKDSLQAGFAKINITPKYSVTLGGYGDDSSRPANGVLADVYATCIAVSSAEETVLLFTVDTLNVNREDAEGYRKSITEATGVPGEKIFIGATHGHNCPSDNGQYIQNLRQWLAEAAQQAIADQSPAVMAAATPEFAGMNFVRHYKMSDGTYAGSNFGTFKDLEILDYATDNDPGAVLLKFDRSGDKKDILMINWQAHPDSASNIGYNSISPSWIGPLRDTVAQETGMLVAYFTGASGNHNISSRIAKDNHGLKWNEYGQKMGQLIVGALDRLQTVEGNRIKTNRAIVEVSVDHSWDSMILQAIEVCNLWQTADLKTANERAYSYGFTSVYQARAIRTRMAKPLTEELELNTFCIGGIGFTTGTYEMFSDASLHVKQNSPFAVTFLITGNSSYIPSKEAYDYRSYESDTGHYAQGTAEDLAAKYVQMLGELQ